MPRIVAFLNNDIIKNMKELYKDSDKSLSKIISELVEIGYKIKEHHKNHASDPYQEQKSELEDKHIEYLLRTMAIVTDIYRCIRNGKSKYNETNIDDALETIANNTQNFINGQLGKDD